MFTSKLARAAAVAVLAAGSSLTTAVFSAGAAHADACIPIGTDTSVLSTSTECAGTGGNVFAVSVEVLANDEAPGATGPEGSIGEEVGVAGVASVTAAAVNFPSTSPGGELEVCVQGAGCSGVESDSPSGGEG